MAAVKYDYDCPACGTITDSVPLDRIDCRCGQSAKRIRTFTVNKPSLRDQGRWDPVVGQYVANDREFREVLKQGQAREAAELGMDVPLVQLDARDQEGLAETHGHSLDSRLEVKEQTEKSKHDEKVKANQEQKPKVLTA